jgi:hypothetical protein
MIEEKVLIEESNIDNDLTIDESNFSQYFRDASKFPPRKGDILVCYRAKADFVYGDLKKDVVDLLSNSTFGAKTSIQIIKKLAKTNEKEAVLLTKTICEDLYSGMTEDEVLAKSYSYLFEMFFFAKKEHVPIDDKHWECMTITNLDEYLEKRGACFESSSNVKM